MTLELTTEESMRLLKQLELSGHMKRKSVNVPAEKKALVIQNYIAGESMRSICKTCHVSSETFYKIRNEYERCN